MPTSLNEGRDKSGVTGDAAGSHWVGGWMGIQGDAATSRWVCVVDDGEFSGSSLAQLHDCG
jgi:hypothetical protein